MKSVMEEASSIIKAIEKGWISAGQPKEFTVKILEEPQRNFIGLTVRSAKIGIFFSDEHVAKPQEESQIRQKPSAPKQAPASKEPSKPRHKQRELKPRTPRAPKEQAKQVQEVHTVQSEPVQEAAPAQQPVWTDAMISDVTQWMHDTLAQLNASSVQFTIEPQHFYLRLNFTNPIFEDKAREKHLFSSLSTLFLQMLKNRYKRPLKGYKIVFIGAA